MSFGWSAGDVVAGITFLVQVYQALDDSSGGKANYAALIRELGNLKNALLEIQPLEDKTPTEPDAPKSALKQAVASCQECINCFIERNRKFAGMDEDASTSKWSIEVFKKNVRAVEWKLMKRKEVDGFRKEVLSHTTTILSLQISALSIISRCDSTSHAERQSKIAQHLQTQVATFQKVESQLQTVIQGQKQLLQESEHACGVQALISSQMQSEKMMLEDIHDRLQSLLGSLEQSLSEQENCKTASECLKDLFVTDPEVDMKEIENRRDYLIPHSCDWAVKQASEYLENPSFNRLWIYGEPGKGKTHIALALVKHLQAFIAKKLEKDRHSLMVDLCSRGDKAVLSFVAQLAGSRYLVSQSVADRISFRLDLFLQKLVNNLPSPLSPTSSQLLDGIFKRTDSHLTSLVKNSSHNAEILSSELATKALEQGDLVLETILNEQADRMKKISKGFLSYYFCDNTSDQRNDIVSVLRSLLRQVLQQVLDRGRSTTDSSKTFLEAFRSKGSKMFLSVESLWIELQRILGDTQFNHACFIVGGLDECETTSVECFLSLLHDQNFQKTCEQPGAAVNRHLQVKWILLSRKSYFRADCFGQHTLAMDLQNHSINIETSVVRYIDIKVGELSKAKGYGNQLELSVRKVLREKAQGTFLWVALACRELKATGSINSYNTFVE